MKNTSFEAHQWISARALEAKLEWRELLKSKEDSIGLCMAVYMTDMTI